MPLFLIVSGFFIPEIVSGKDIRKRFKTIMIPYFFWALFLYVFWLVIGRKMGDSSTFGLSPLKNLLGVFYSQGDKFFMDWGIPMWFLPNIFLAFVFLIFGKMFFGKFYRLIAIVFTTMGFFYARFSEVPLFWSLDVSWISMLFVAFGKDLFKLINSYTKIESIVLMLIFFGINILLYTQNIKIDMYRSIYGNEILFLLNGVSGSLFFIFFFKLFPVFNFLEIVGKFTIIILAFQILAMSVIKFVLLYIFKISDFDFSETQKFVFAILQTIMILPIGYFVNKYVPLLNGGFKKI